MADPIFDEQGIIDMLSVPVAREYSQALKAGAAQAIIDMFDRKVTRDEFCKALEPVLNLYSYVGRLQMVGSIRDTFDKGELTPMAFDDANKQLSEFIRQSCLVTIETVKRLKECPTSGDKVH
jgi:hypothetical protein